MKNIYRILLGVISILVLAFLPLANNIQPAHGQTNACASSSPVSGAYTATICITNPADGSNLTGDAIVTATINVTGTNPLVQRMVFLLNGAYLLTDYQNFYTFSLPTTKWVDGSYTISASALMRDGFTTGQASVLVNFQNGITTPPVNTNQFTPSTGNPPAPGAPFIVAAGGDGAAGDLNSESVSNLILAQNPNLFLYLGDVYEKGSTAEFYNWYGTGSTFFSRLRSITDPTIGNHEYLNSSPPAYFDYWNNIPNYYSFNAGGWHFISLNSNASNIPVISGSAQYNWLQQDLAANPGTCTIVYYHQPLFNIGPEGTTPAMADIWKLMAQYGVNIVLNGHDHDYQRWVPLDGNGNPSLNGITEFVVGSAGHGLQTINSSDTRVAYSNSSNPAAFGVLLLQLNQNSANFNYLSISGSTLDSGVIPCSNPAPQPGAGVMVGGVAEGSASLAPDPFATLSIPGVDNGPVQVASTTGDPIIASERVAYSPDGGSTWTSYAELMGLPTNKLTDTYLFPWYNSLNLSAQVSFANVGTSDTIVTVTIGGVPQGSYPLTPNQSMRIKYPGVNNGPVKVQSTGGVKIVASERISFTPDAGATYTNYYELMGLPASSLTTSYIFPWYNSLNLSSQVSFANVGTSDTTVTVTIGGVPQGSYPLTPNQSLRIKYPGLNTGPVTVESTGGVPIVASERVSYTPDGGATYPGFSEMMGLPVEQLTNNYYFPGYNSLQHSMQVSFANVGNANTTVTVTIAGVPQGSYPLIPNQSMRLKYTGLNTGPVQVSSTGGVPIITSERVSYTPDGGVTYPSFSEMLGLPAGQLTTSYLFPWYNNVNLDTQLKIAAPNLP